MARALAELALAEGRYADAAEAARAGFVVPSGAEPHAPVALTLAALGLRALAEQATTLRVSRALEALEALDNIAGQGDALLAGAQAVSARHAGGLAPEPAAWLRQCRAEHTRLHGHPDPAAWADVATGWDLLAEPYPAAYARLRHAEALLSTRATKTQAAVPLNAAAQVAQDLGARPLLTRRRRTPARPARRR